MPMIAFNSMLIATGMIIDVRHIRWRREANQ
jgi:hypothetical protein